MKKVTKTLSFTIILLILLFAILFGYFFFQSKGNIDKTPSIFGYKPLTILSNSMQPTFNAGDVVLINVNNVPQINEVVTYKQPDGRLITHRIIKNLNKNGKTYFQTKGDNNNTPDDELIPTSRIIGVEKFVIPKVGYIAQFVSGPIGFFLFIVLPILLLVIIQIFKWLGLIGSKEQNI
ncbi:signal peptidase I [Neobacillus pocheonensis]|uniref:signal peptidase I n=1 Tax=Neobacillus pocheonensis TaxID=363869 RepID=UPI003D2A0A23